MKESLSGVDGVRTALNTVLSELHKVLYKQLLAWLLQGNLYDPYQGRTSHFSSLHNFLGIRIRNYLCGSGSLRTLRKNFIYTAVCLVMIFYLYRHVNVSTVSFKQKKVRKNPRTLYLYLTSHPSKRDCRTMVKFSKRLRYFEITYTIILALLWAVLCKSGPA
jgi:hypothetical protein